MTAYNIYFGTIGNKLGVKYRYTQEFKNEQSAIEHAKRAAESFYFKNEGKYGVPSYSEISKESKITRISIESLYAEHIKDITRFYAIPTELDTIPSYKLKW